jgi:hypothetical protein
MDVSNTTVICGFLATMATSVIVPLVTRWLSLQDRKQEAEAAHQQALDTAAALKEHTTRETSKQTAEIAGALDSLANNVNGKMEEMLDAREAKGHADEKLSALGNALKPEPPAPKQNQ